MRNNSGRIKSNSDEMKNNNDEILLDNILERNFFLKKWESC